MRVRMKVDISGVRDGQPWPGRGKTIDLPDDEAATLCVADMAEPVADHQEAETATVPDDSEKRALTTATAAAVTPDQPATEPKAPAKKTAAKRTAAKPAESK